jgi:Domain of unknown function (DUF4112)
VLGLVPWIGDAVTLLFGAVLLVTAAQLRVPRVIQARIAFTAMLDFILGLVPVAGDLFDFAFRANARSMALLDRHAYERRPSSFGDRFFVAVVLGAMTACVAVPALLLIWLARVIGAGWF